MKKQRKKAKTCEEIEKENENDKNEKIGKRKKKRAQWGTTRDGPKKLIFYKRALIGNGKAIEAKKEDFEHPRKKRQEEKKKENIMNENERK